jgi:hypothetical protein
MKRHLRSVLLTLSLVAASALAIACTPGSYGATTAPGASAAPGAPSVVPAPSTVGGYGY